VALQAQRRDVRIGFERGMGYMKCCATYLMCPQFEMGEVPGVCARFRDRGPPPPHRGRAIVSSAGRAITVSQWMYKDVKQPAAARTCTRQCGLVFPDLVPSRLPGLRRDDCERLGPRSTPGRMSGDEGQW
jgi:hypothetical protein